MMIKIRLITTALLLTCASYSFAQLNLLPVSEKLLKESQSDLFMRDCKGYFYNSDNQVVGVAKDGFYLHINLEKHGKQVFSNSLYGNDFILKRAQASGDVDKKYHLHFTNQDSPFIGGAYVQHLKKIADKEHQILITVYEKQTPYSVGYIGSNSHQYRLKETCKHQSEGSLFFQRSKAKEVILSILGGH